MGNEHSINKSDGVVFQNNGKYITPNKLYHAQTGQQEAIVNNIFGINDPTILTRSYWAKQQSKSPYNKNDPKQQSRSRLYTDSLIRPYHQFEPELTGHYEDNLDRRQEFKKSIITDFRCEQGNESRQFKNLSKNTSYSIIHKLKCDDENRSQSQFKNLQSSKNTDLRYSKFTKDKENFNYLLGSANKNNSQIKDNDKTKQNLQRSVSQFKGTQKQSHQSLRRKVLDDVTLKSQITNIFGLENVPQQNCGQLTDRLQEELKSMRNCEVEQQKSRITERTFKNDEIQQRNWNHQKDQISRTQHDFSEQTFSRFQQQNACPAYLSKIEEKQLSDRISQKTVSKKSNMQRYKGLNQDSQNESLMKVMKRLTDLNLPIEENEINHPSKEGQIEEYHNENESEILEENMDQNQQKNDVRSNKLSQKLRQKSSQKLNQKSIQESIQKSSKKSSQKSSEKYQQNSKKSHYEFDLHEIKLSQKSANSQMNIKSKSKISQLYESNQGSKKSFGGQSSKSSNKHSLSNHVNNDNFAPSSLSNNYCLENDIYHTESSQGFDDGYSQKFHFPRNLSPRSLAQQQRTMIRQRSCSGRLIQASKVSEKSKKESQNCSKNFDFSKKSIHQNQDLPIYSRNLQSQESSKFSKLSTKDFSLMLKIQSLQQELKMLKEKQEQGKFQSRRYSPVKQQRMKISKKQDSESESETGQDFEGEPSKYCINDVSATKPLKRRSQYFRLKIK